MQRALAETKQFWQAKGLWPETTPVEEQGPAVTLPDDMVYALGDDIPDWRELEDGIVEAYTDDVTRAYSSATAQRFVEYRDGLTRDR